MVNTNSNPNKDLAKMLTGFSSEINHKAAPVTAITNVGLSAAELNMTTEINTSAK